MEAEEIGRASVDLGAGRLRKGDPVDPAAGIVFEPKIGDQVETGRKLGEIHGRDEDAARAAASRVIAAVTLSHRPVDPPPLVYGWLGTDEER
jgi:thymidine phosphorylase